MPRPRCCRWVRATPPAKVFKPAGRPLSEQEPLELTLDEFEALRLADYSGMYHEEAAALMQISRPTFTRLVTAARQKVAAMLVEGKPLIVQGGEIKMVDQREQRTFVCSACGHKWQLPFGTGRPEECPACHSKDIHRDPAECGEHGHRHGHGGECAGRGGQKSGRGRCCRRRKPSTTA